MASVWDWLPGPSGLWNYLSQTPEADWLRRFPERYRDQIREGLMEFSERGGTPASRGYPLLSALNPLRPLVGDTLLKVGEGIADMSNRIQRQGLETQRMLGAETGEFKEMTAEEGALIPSLALSATGLGKSKVAGDAVRDFIGKTKFYSPTRRALAKAQDKGTGKQFVAAV